MDPAPVDIVDRVRTVEVDTCDACSAEARVRAFLFVTMPSGHSLAFCGSHGNRFLPELHRQGARIVDMTHLLHEPD